MIATRDRGGDSARSGGQCGRTPNKSAPSAPRDHRAQDGAAPGPAQSLGSLPVAPAVNEHVPSACEGPKFISPCVG